MGGFTPYGTGPGVFPGPGGTETDGVYSMAEVRLEIGVHLGGGGKTGGRV